MLKNILNLNGAQQLSKKEQQIIQGGCAGAPGGSTCANWDYQCHGKCGCNRGALNAQGICICC